MTAQRGDWDGATERRRCVVHNAEIIAEHSVVLKSLEQKVDRILTVLESDKEKTGERRLTCEKRFATLETKSGIIGAVFGACAGYIVEVFKR